MTDAEKVASARFFYEMGVCPGCGYPLENVAGAGAGHSASDGAIRGGGPRGDMCSWSADDLAALVHIGSGLVKYHPPSGTTAPQGRRPPPERLPRPGASSDLPLSGRGPT